MTQDAAAPLAAFNAVLPTAGSTTLLSYAAMVRPDPLQVTVGGAITLAISNASRVAITVTTIQITLSPGTTAKDLSPSLDALGISTPTDWQAKNESGIVTLTPKTKDAAQIGRDGLAFIFTNFTVNDECGTTTIIIDETASSPSQPSQDRTASIDVPKFPAEFFVSDLGADPNDVSNGDTTTLTWSGSGGANTTYQMVYVPADTSDPISESVGNTGPYLTEALTRTGAVVFNLIVSVKVDGHDAPLVVHRQTSVTIEKTTALITATPMIVGVNGLVHLTWSTARAASCTLEPAVGPSHNVATQGEAFVTLASARTFTVTAYDASGVPVQSQVTISIDPTIKANQTGQTATAANGSNGADGQPGRANGHPGQNGGQGSNAQLSVALGPIDSSSAPANVIPITVIGGAGGKGGDGGYAPWGPQRAVGGTGGSGGPGGSATLTATVGTTGSAAQYIVVAAGGAGGHFGYGGQGADQNGPNGSPGATGSVTATVNGLPLGIFP